jgi:23S rRNA (guanosine2251-2'-O)-methyltransferase
MGSEGSGISRLLKENCDEVVSIPTFGKIDSLNVSVAAGVLLFATL